MPSLFVMTESGQSLDEAEKFAGDELLMLIIIDRATLATNFEGDMATLEARAGAVRRKLASRGVPCRVVVEWGDKTEVVSNTLIRENAALLNKF